MTETVFFGIKFDEMCISFDERSYDEFILRKKQSSFRLKQHIL